jgi:hypothetical protein
MKGNVNELRSFAPTHLEETLQRVANCMHTLHTKECRRVNKIRRDRDHLIITQSAELFLSRCILLVTDTYTHYCYIA